MNIIKKKCMLITPCNVTFRTSSGKEIKPNTKSIEFVLTKEILVAMNSGIRVFEIGSDGKQVQLNKSNFDKINVLMNYDETTEEKEAPTEAPVGPVKITPAWLKGETDHPTEDKPKDEETVDPAEEESPSEEDDEPEDEEVDMTPQEDPEAKYYDTDSDSKDDCDEEKENGEDDEFNID